MTKTHDECYSGKMDIFDLLVLKPILLFLFPSIIVCKQLLASKFLPYLLLKSRLVPIDSIIGLVLDKLHSTRKDALCCEPNEQDGPSNMSTYRSHRVME